MDKIFIGLSWPYANDELHIGHLGSSLPADVLARYYRLKGSEVCFVSGSDCFGTPISIKAQLEGKSAKEVSDFYHERFVQIFKELNFSFDNYTKTSSNYHINFAKEFHRELYNTNYVYKKEEQRLYCSHCNRFLPDRYVVGLCPNCGNTTKGDACEKCGKILEPEELLEPKCGICANEPIFKNNFQYYIKLSKLEEKLKEFFNKRKNGWLQNAVNLTERYFLEGLLDRAISRDLDWGVPIPVDGLKDKVIYNWGENVLGYIAACKEFCEQNNKNFADWFETEDVKHIYVHAKDNIQFHTIIYPALIIANNNKYHLPDNIFSYEFVTNNGQKISKSRGTCLTVRQLLETFDVDFLRFYFAKNVTDKKDLDFSLTELISSVNGELINNWGNFVNRTLSFIKSKFNGKINKFEVSDLIKNKIISTYNNVGLNFESGKIAQATKLIFELIDFANKYFDQTKPWQIIKEDSLKCEQLCYEYITIIANVSVLLNPIIPQGTGRVLDWLNIKNYSFYYFEPNQLNLTSFEPLYSRIIN